MRSRAVDLLIWEQELIGRLHETRVGAFVFLTIQVDVQR